MRRDDALLLDMLLAARRIRRFAEGLDEQDFLESDITQSAMMREVIVIGEAANRVSLDLQRSHPEIAWREIIGLRNRVVHEYFRINLVALWEVSLNDIPQLIRQIEPLIPPDDDEDTLP